LNRAVAAQGHPRQRRRKAILVHAKIPDDFWHEMRNQHLVAANAPLPIDR
jgi:hypothetical protein